MLLEQGAPKPAEALAAAAAAPVSASAPSGGAEAPQLQRESNEDSSSSPKDDRVDAPSGGGSSRKDELAGWLRKQNCAELPLELAELGKSWGVYTEAVASCLYDADVSSKGWIPELESMKADGDLGTFLARVAKQYTLSGDKIEVAQPKQSAATRSSSSLFAGARRRDDKHDGGGGAAATAGAVGGVGPSALVAEAQQRAPYLPLSYTCWPDSLKPLPICDTVEQSNRPDRPGVSCVRCRC